MSQKTITVAGLLLCCIFIVSGCGKKTGLDGLYPVKGKLTLDGVPVEGVTINLTPGSVSNETRPATGLTDANGEFKIRTLDPDDGAYPGEYYVTLTKMVPDGKVPTTEELDAARDAGKRIEIKMKNDFPAKYSKIMTSGLTFKVSPDNNEDLVLDLKSK